MEGYNIEPEKGTDCHERQQPASGSADFSTPVAVTSCELPADPPDHVQTELISSDDVTPAINLVSLNGCGMQSVNQGRLDDPPAVYPEETDQALAVSGVGEKQQADSESLSKGVVCLHSVSRSTEDAEDAQMEELCSTDATQSTRSLDTPDKITTKSAEPQTSCDSQASSDGHHAPSSSNRAEVVNAKNTDAHVNLVEDRNVRASDNVPAHIQSCSGAAEQFEMMEEKSEKRVGRDADSAIETIVCSSEYRNVESAGGVASTTPNSENYSNSVRKETEKSDISSCDQDKGSCGQSSGDEDDDEDIITLTEEDFQPSFVITNVCSVKDDDTCVFDHNGEGECNAGIQEVSDHDSVDPDDSSSNSSGAEEHTETEQQTGNHLPLESSTRKSLESSRETAATENGTDSEDGLPPSPAASSAPRTVPEAVSPAEESSTESGIQALGYEDRTNKLSADVQEGNTGNTNNMASIRNSDSSLEATKKQVDCFAEQKAGYSDTMDELNEEPDASDSLVMKLEPDDADFEMEEETVHSVAESVDIDTSSRSYSSGTSFDSTKRKRPFSEVETEQGRQGGEASQSKKRGIDLTCTEMSDVPAVGDRHFSELSSTDLCQQAGKGDACSLTDSVAQADTQSSQVNLQPQVQAQHSTISKSLLIPSNLTAKKGNTQPCNAATKSVFLTIPSALGGDGTRSVHLTTHRAPGTFKRINLQVKNSGKEAVGRASSTTKTYQGAKRVMTKMTSQAGHKTGTDHSQGGTLSVADSSVQKVAHVMDSSPHTHKTSISANSDSTEPREHTHSSSSVVTADTSMPISEKRIFAWKDKTQGKGSADSGTCSLLSPSFMVRAKERNIGQVSLIQPGTVRERSAFLVTQTFQPVSSSVPLTSVTHPNVVSTLLTPSVPSTWASAPAEVITVDSGGQASGQVAVGTSQVSTGVQNAQSASSGMKPVLVIQDVACPAVSETATLDPKQSSQVEPVSSQAKLSASDMASLIKGKNLVPSLEPRPQPPHKSGAVNSVYRCVECNHMYSTLLGYTAHVKRMSMVIRYACMVCKTALVFFNKCTFLAHLRKHMTFNAFRGLVLNLKSYTMSVSSLPKQLLPPVEVQYMDPLMINRSQPVTCTECRETFPDTWRLAQHFSAVEFCRFEHCCSHCNMQLPTACALKAHLRLHDAKFHTFCAQPPYVCPECGLQFVTQLSLYQHLYATCLHFNRCVTLRCYSCNNWYPTLESLEEHIHLKHPNTKCFKCLVCKKRFSSLLLFTHHLPHPWAQKDEKARKKVVPSCTACNDEDDLVEGRSSMPQKGRRIKIFEIFEQRHAQMHTESAKSIAWFGFTCLFCQDFLTMSLHTLVQHLNVKHAAYKFSCSVCLQGFVMLSLLRSHVLSTHSSRDRGKKALYSCCCANCAASLGPDSALPHVMWHAVKKVPEVTYTTETSALVENRRSMSIVASSINSKSFREQANTRAYFCRSCGHVFPTNADLQKHLAKSQHSVCGTFSTCPCCQRFDFASQDIFIQHTLTCITQCKDVFFTLSGSEEERDAEQTRNPRPSPGDKDQAVVDTSGGIDTEDLADVDMSCRTDTREQTTSSAPGHTNQIKITNTCSDSTGGTIDKGPVQTTVSVLASQTSNADPGHSNVPGPTSSPSRETPSSSSGSGPSLKDSGTTVCSEVLGSGTVVCSEVLGSGTTVRSEVQGSGTVVRSEVQGSGTTVRSEVQGSGTTVCTEVLGSGTTVRSEVQGSGTTVCTEVLGSGTTVRSEVQGQSTVGSSEKSPSSSTSGDGAPNKSDLSFKFDSRRTIVVFTKNGKIVGHKEMVTTKETGSSKQVTREALTTRPAKSLVDQRFVKLLLSKSATSSMLHKPATEKPATSVAPSSGGQSQESSSGLQLSKSPFSVSQEQGDDDKEGLTWMEVPRDTAQPDPQQLYHPCPLCGLTYESADQLASHRASVHMGEMKTVLSCQLCKKKGKTIILSKGNLKKHLIRRHKVGSPAAETMVAESACGQTAASSSTEDQAQASSTPKRSSTDSESSTVSADPVRCLRVSNGDQQDYVCAKCDFSSPAMEEFHSHIKGHAVDNSVQCLECGLCYSAISSLKKHLFMVHKVKQPDVYITQHDIRLEELPVDFASHMDTLTPLGQSEEARRTAEVFHEDFYKTLPHSPKPADRKEKRRRSNSDCLECNVCYKEFENEGELKSHMRNHGMAFIRSRRATP